MCCMYMNVGHPGIAILDEIHKKYPKNVQKAWEILNSWVKKAQVDSEDGYIKRSDMPKDVREAMQLILDTLIPGYEGATGKDSCYMIKLCSALID